MAGLGLLHQSHNDSGSNDTGFGPHTVPLGEIYASCCGFYTGYVRLCNEKGAMSSCWKYAGFCGYFSFLSRRCFWLSFLFFFPGILSLVELLCIPGRNNVGHIAGLVWSNHRSGVLLFLWWLAELCAPLHLEWIMSTRWWIIISKGSILHLKSLQTAILAHFDHILDYTGSYSTIYAKKHISLYFDIKTWYCFLLVDHMSEEVTSSCTNFYQNAYGIQVSISLQCTTEVSRA